MSTLAASTMHWEWLGSNAGHVLELTANHLYQGIVPVIIGTVLSIPVARYASRRRAVVLVGQRVKRSAARPGSYALVQGFGLLYTIPSIALFVLMPLLLGTSIISSVNVLVALTIYTMALMVRSGVDAFESVPDAVLESSRALGYTPARAFFAVELPLAVPVLFAGIRVATVANIAMVSVGALIGVPSLGTLFTDGLARDIPAEIITGVVLSAVLALAVDALLAAAAQRLSAWRNV